MRVYIDKPGGVTVDDCAAVSERVSVILDVEDFIPHKYMLEVASPGLDRGLYKEADYERFAGLPAHIRIDGADRRPAQLSRQADRAGSGGRIGALIEDETGSSTGCHWRIS